MRASLHFGWMVACLLAGCGSASLCEGPPAPCGGDVVGTWSAVDTCYETSCSGLEVTKKPDNATTLTFRSDGMATASVSLTGTVAFKEPVTCLTGSANQCTDLNEPAQNGNSLTCSGDTTCDCNGTVSVAVSSPNAFAYSTNGTNLMFIASTLAYCVQGDHLFLRFNGSGSNSPIATTTMVLKRN